MTPEQGKAWTSAVGRCFRLHDVMRLCEAGVEPLVERGESLALSSAFDLLADELASIMEALDAVPMPPTPTTQN